MPTSNSGSRMSEPDILLLPADLADLIQVPERTLELWRYTGDGPPPEASHKNLVFYSLGKVKSWLSGLNELPLPPNTLHPAGARRVFR